MAMASSEHTELMPDRTVPASESSARYADGKPKLWAVLYSIAKKKNVGNLVRSCVAFGVQELVVIGARDLTFMGDQGTKAFLPIRRFHTLADAQAWFRSHSITITGVEITPDAVNITRYAEAFDGDTALMFGNEGDGMSEAAKAICDKFVYIPQHSCGTASLNVSVAAAIALHHFALYAEYAEAPREPGADKYYKQYIVAPPGGAGTQAEKEVAAAREEASAKNQAAREDAIAGAHSLFDCEDE